ncbi:polyketide synthase dehydratase-domain-containing protein [Annulohypoxylon stygium]|nr:polyketide synthase dehydratase-domain-containing protein [Annulohypoxylon stygium]
MIPPNIKFSTPNPKIPFREKRLTVPTKPTPFPAHKAERVSVNSFGIGGSNAHVILESFPDTELSRGFAHTARRPELLILSANTQNSLKTQIELFQEYVSQHPSAIRDVAYTLALRRERLPHRAYMVMSGDKLLETSSMVKTPGKLSRRKVTMVFTGQGSQWAEMGKGLFITSSEFREDIHLMDDILRHCAKPPRWTLEAEILKPFEISGINKAELAQPMCTALQIAIFRQLKRLGVIPTAVVGHSSGEIAAAYAAGLISLEFAVKAAYYRGLVSSKSTTRDGSMAAIGLGAKEVARLLPEGVVVACENSPHSTTISGDRALVEQTVSTIKAVKPDVFARMLKVDMAYHSHHMDPLAKDYLHMLRQEKNPSDSGAGLRRRSIFMSSVTAKVIDNPTDLGPEYWVANLVSPVRFRTAVKNLFELRGDSDVLLEIGPHGALAGPLRQICTAGSWQCNYVAAQNRGSDSAVSLLAALGRLFQENVTIDFAPLFSGGRVVPGLPSYAWDRSGQSFWHESRLSTAWRQRKYPHHCVLGVRDPQSPDAEPLWRNILHLDDAPWLVDHKVSQDIIFPFAGYVATAGEAIRQVAGADPGSSYHIRHLVVRTALVLTDSKPVEIVTTLRQKRLTDNDESQWYEFNITSYSGSAWIKHCTGEVKHVEGPSSSFWTPEGLPRKLPGKTFYDTMERNGFIYGPEFQTLSDIAASTTEQAAEARMIDKHNHVSQPFSLHPAAIDGCLQLLMIAATRGLCRNFDGLAVPTSIEELTISRGAAEMHAHAWAKKGDLRLGEVELVAGGHVALKMRGLQLTPLEDDDVATESIDKHAAAHVQWLPDFDFVDHRSLFAAPKPHRAHLSMQQELAFLCMVQELEAVEGIQPCQPHFAKLRDWMKKEVQDATVGKSSFPLVENPARLVKLSSDEQKMMIDSHLAILEKGYHSALSVGLKRVLDHAAEIFAGTRETLDVLMQGNLLAEIYNHTSFGYGDFVRLLSNTRPNLRILEVGAGTGGTTELILRGLVDEGGFPIYSVYTFTDVSSGFLVKARERFSYAPNMEYKVLDISKSPADQGFKIGEKESYDLILAANVVHATPFITETLGNIKSLLKPDGMLVLTELLPTLRTANYMFGHFAGWWLGEADARPANPLIPVERWNKELQIAGFAGVDSFVADDEAPYNQIVTIVSRPESMESPPPKQVTLLCENEESSVAKTLSASLKSSGWEVTPCRLTSTPPAEQDIISCLNLESDWFNNLTKDDFSSLQKFAKAVEQQKILWLARPVQIRCTDPRPATFIGAARSLRAEVVPGLCTLEINADEPQFADLVLQVFNKVRTQEDIGTLGPDREFAVENSQICIPRYHPFSLTDRLKENNGVQAAKPVAENTRTALNVGKTGSMETLHWIDEPLPLALPADHVEIETRAVGLNFRDVLLARGILQSPTPGRIPLGYELSGIITKVGSAVTDLVPGDRVMALCNGCLGTRNVAPADIVMTIPDSLSYESAATVPVCFGTVSYGLIDIARLEEGQSVLIHSACGGVGLAAMQVSKMLGAEIYATVGSEKKVKYLMDNFGIPRNRIFNSRDASFAEGVMRETEGRGVDVVLNSLSGELLHESWRCVAKFGIMVELGLRDSKGSGSLNMLPFAENRSYHGVNLSEFRERPKWLRRLLNTFVKYYNQGLLQPIDPVVTFDAKQISRAFRHLEDGDHLGKVTVSFSGARIESVPQRRNIKFDPSATYMLVGGVGGLGRSIATWMVERGARSLTFLSRSAGLSEVSKDLFRELESMGCSVTAVAGRVDSIDDVQGAVHRSRSPIKGVIQLAMVLRDAPILDMEWSQWQDALAPKVAGTWNLHKAFESKKLDFFFLASSLVTVADSVGQGNYVAASMFIEAFCRYRHSLGLPASVLNIGPVRDVGFVAENAHAMQNIKAQGLSLLSEREFLDFFELSLLDSHPTDSAAAGPLTVPPKPWYDSTQVIMGLRSEQDLDDPNTRTMWRRDRRMGLYHNVRIENAAKTSESDALQEFLAQVTREGGKKLLKEEKSLNFLAHEIGGKIYDFLLRPDEEVDVSLTLAQMGLDSLMAIELRRWFKGAFGLTISVLEIVGSGTLIQLAGLVTDKLVEKLESESQKAA